MLTSILAGLLLVAAAVAPAVAQSQTAAGACKGAPNALGVSRVIEIDTTGGPRFGQQQYKDVNFLQDGEVVLTFDDGPLRQNTRLVLDALAQHCTKATFFVVGKMATSDPEMVRDIVRRGHTVGTHTWSHRNLRTLSAEEARKEIELGFSAVRMAAGAPIAPFFRFPYLSDPGGSIQHVRGRSIGIFSIDVDAYDYRTPSPSTVIHRVMRGLESTKKGIVLFHDIQPSTAHALKSLLDQLAGRGYRIVHLVPKTDVQTVAAYDQIAEREFSRRKMMLAANPLASRAITWTQSSGTQITRIAPASGAPVQPPPVTAVQRPLPPMSAQPVQQAAVPVAPVPLPQDAVAPPPRAPRGIGEQSWQSRAFGTTY